MNADHLSYQRATSVSIIGLAIQLVLGLTLLLYGIFGQDPVARAGAIVVFLGAPVWLALVLVFHQHKRERLEAQENEQYRSSGAAGASVFGDEENAETVQADKLAWMHRFFLPGVSLILAVSYIASGLFRFSSDVAKHITPDTYNVPPQSGAAIAVGVALLVVGFILARFVAGMAKQKSWSLLHAGAAASIATTLIGGLLVIGHGLELGISFDRVLRYGPGVIDVLMVVLGAEIVLNFVLTLYRPRKAGEYLRPAFDSRVLAFLAAPDRVAESVSDAINYQLGFDVSSTWFYRLVSRSLVGLAILSVVTLWGMTCFAVVQPDERGLLISGGDVVEELGSGTVIKTPWPFARVQTYPADAVSSFTVGLETVREDPSKPLLWTDPNPPGSRFLLARASSESADREGELALLIGEVPVQYSITDLRAYMGLAADGGVGETESMRRGVLRATASSVLTRFFLDHTMDALLGPKRSELENELRRVLQAEYDARQTTAGTGAGVQILFAGLQGIRPPQGDVATEYEASLAAEYFRDALVEVAKAERIGLLSQATGNVDLANDVIAALDLLDEARAAAQDDDSEEAQRLVIERELAVSEMMEAAGGDAAIKIIEARTERWRRHLTERTRAVLTPGRNAAYLAAPEVYRMQLFVDTFSRAIRGVRVWITPFDVRVSIDNTELNTDIGLGPGLDSDTSGQE